MKDSERDQLRRYILKLVAAGPLNYTIIEKKAVATCMPFATSNTVGRQLNCYLVPQGYIERISRGKYRITPKGERLLDLLSK